MGNAARDRRTGAPLPVSLHELLAAVGPQSRPFDPWAATGDAVRDEYNADAYLSVTLRGRRCLLPLGLLRGILAERPRVVRVPRAPRWLLGIFPYRAELIALVDPAPMLFGDAESDGPLGMSASTRLTRGGVPGNLEGVVVIVGSGERSLGWLVERAGESTATDENSTAAMTGGADGSPILDAFTSQRLANGDGTTLAAATVVNVEAAMDALLAELEEDGHE